MQAVTSSPGGAYESQTLPSRWAGSVESTSVESRFGPMGLPDRRHWRLQCARGVEVSHPACLLSADDRERRSARRELAGGSRAAHGPQSVVVGDPRSDRLHVVPGHLVEAAVRPSQRALLLDRADGWARRLRDSPRVRDKRHPAELRACERPRLFRRARLCDGAHPRAVCAPRGGRGGALHYQSLAWHLQPAPRRSLRMAVELCVPDFPLRQFRCVRGGTGAGADAWLRGHLQSLHLGAGLGGLVRLIT